MSVPPAEKGSQDIRPTKLTVALAFAPDNRHLAGADHDGVDLIDPRQRTGTRVIAECGVWDLGFSSDGPIPGNGNASPDVNPRPTSCVNSCS